MILHNPVAGYIHPRSWVRPAGSLAFKVTQRFGCTGVAAERPLGTCLHFHRAIDIGNAHEGADVLAAAAGTLVYSGISASGSQNIVINHGGGWYSGYAHLKSRTVFTKGYKVAPGERIGFVGKTGATAPHLHFAVKSGITVVMADPYAGFWGDVRGKWEDPWPLLAQNT